MTDQDIFTDEEDKIIQKSMEEKYAYLNIKAGDYVQIKEPVKGKILRIIETEATDQWGMALPDAEINILDGQTIIVRLTALEKQKG